MVISWNVALLAIGTTIIELLFGGWLDAVREPALWRLSIYRNVDWTFSTDTFYRREGSTVYRRDHYGLRGNYGNPEDINILVVGGSTTDERFVSEGETWTDVLGTCLQSASHPARVANAGVSGQSSRGHIRNFEVWFNHIPGLKPRYVIAYVGVNERHLDGRVSEDDPQTYNESKTPLWFQRLKLNSALYGLYRVVAGNLAAYRGGIHHLKAFSRRDGETAAEVIDRQFQEVSQQRLNLDSPQSAERLDAAKKAFREELVAYRQRLARLVKMIHEFGGIPILVTQPLALYRIIDGQVHGNLDRYFEMRAINDVALDLCRELGVMCIDLAGSLPVGDGDFYDSVHATAKGSRKIGLRLCEHLKRMPEFALPSGTRPK